MPGNASNLNNGTTHSNVDNSNASGSHYSVLSTNGDVVVSMNEINFFCLAITLVHVQSGNSSLKCHKNLFRFTEN